MIKFNYIAFCLLAIIATSCGSSKESKPDVKTSKSSKNGEAFSTKDYPYIEAFHKAVRLKTVGDVDGAIAAFGECLAIKQDDDAVYYALSELQLAKGNMVEATSNITKARNLDPKNIWYTQELAYMLYEARDYAKALPEFKKLVEYEGKNLQWLYGYGDCLLRAGKTQEAINVLTKAEDIMGVNPNLSIEKYNLYMAMKKESEAINEIQLARNVFPNDPQLIATLVDHYFQKGDSEKAIGFLEELVKNDPDNGRAHLALGDIYRQQNKKTQSYNEFKAAFKCQDVDIDAKMKVLILLQEASYKPEPGAIELMEMLVTQYPDDAKPHSIRGDYMLALENDQEAILSYRRATELDKNQYPIWNQLLLLDYQNGNFEELYVDSKNCLEYFTTMPTVYLLNGIGAIQTKHYDEAISSLETGKSLIINDKGMEAEFYGQLGDAYFSKKNYQEGQKNFDKALSIDPKSNLIRNNYAYKLALANIQLEKAYAMIQKVVESSPGMATYMDTKGLVLFMQKKYDEAFAMFDEALKLNSKQPDINEHLGDAYFKRNMIDKALEYWNIAKELGSENKNLTKKIESKNYYEPIYD